MKNGATANYVKGIVLKLINDLAKNAKGARKGKDIEYIHQFRVTSRRLRNALWVFKGVFNKKQLVNYRTVISNVVKTMSRSRDLDVKLVFLEELQKSASTDKDRRSLEALISVMSSKRAAFQKKVIKGLNNLDRSKVMVRIEKWLGRSNGKSGNRKSPNLNALSRNCIAKRLKDVSSYDPFVVATNNPNELHRMRIAAKKLRYTLECFGPLYGDEMTKFIGPAKEIQTLLGSIHDYDVWIGSLPKFTSSEKGKGDLDWGITLFKRKCVTVRKRIHRKFVRYWKKIRQEEVWESLVSLIESRQ